MSFDEEKIFYKGEVCHQKAPIFYLQDTASMEDSSFEEQKCGGCPNKIFQLLQFLLQNWKRRKKPLSIHV